MENRSVIAPNVLHALLLVLALACARFTLSELRHRSLTRTRIIAPAGLALLCACIFLFFQIGAQRPAWLLAVALVGGLALGAVRGATMRLEVDHMYERARLPRARGSFMVSLALVLAVLAEIVGAFVGSAALPFRLAAPDVVAACAGILTGRALAITVRWRNAPHVHLSRPYGSRRDGESIPD
jgi:hypothetical protein